MRVMVKIFILTFSFLQAFRCEEETFNCTSVPSGSKKATIPSLPEKYRVSYQFVDTLKKFSADFTEYYEKQLNLSVLRCDEGSRRYDCIIDRTAATFTFVNKTGDRPDCDVNPLDKSPHGDPFFLPDDPIKLSRKIFSLNDLVDFINSSETLIFDSSNHTDHDDHGIPVSHLLACQKTTDNKYWLEFKICLSDKDFAMSGVKNSQSLPTRIDFRVYDATTGSAPKKTYFDSVYELYGYRVNLDDEDFNYHLPPQGVYCQGRKQTKPVPPFPEDFSVSIEYIDVNSKIADHAKVRFVLYPKKTIGIDFSLSGKEEPIVSSIGRDLKPGYYRIVQDFKTGLQYNLEFYSSKCLNTTSIQGTDGGTTTTTTKHTFLMKNGFELLFVLSRENYTYVGQRYDDDLYFDVWNAFETKKPHTDLEQNITYELWFYQANWSKEGFVSTINNTFPFMFKVYLVDKFNRENITVHKFSNFAQYSNARFVESYNNTNVLWPDLNVLDCYDPFAEFIVQINDTLNSLKSVGLGVVTKVLRDQIANITGLRPLRISNIHFWADDDKTAVNVTFSVSKKSKEASPVTEYYEKEPEAREAMSKLNQTISLADVVLNQTGITGVKQVLALRKGSLSMISVFPRSSVVPPTIIKPVGGYSGGSMATLAFFMLFIGGGAGVVLAYQYLKRARGGIAYQIYE